MSILPEIDKLSPAQLEEQRKSNPQSVLIDVLPATRFEQVRIPGAINACVYEVVFLDTVKELVPDQGRSIIVYGANPRTHDACTAADKLIRAGYRNVAVLEGGLETWQQSGRAIEGEIPRQAETPILPDGNYPIDVEVSRIEWAGRNPNGAHVGTLKLAEGEVQVKNGEVAGQVIIDMTSIENTDLADDELQPVLETHLKSDDFFFVSLFPTARFELSATPTTTISPVSAPNYAVKGDLSLRGVKAEQTFDATIVTNDDGQLIAEAHFDIDRTRWGVIYGSCRFFEHLGMHRVYDLISLQLRIVTRKE